MQTKLNEAYRQRALATTKLAALAQRLGCEVCRTPRGNAEWTILYIELPEGQISYHYSNKDEWMIDKFPVNNTKEWDGKYSGRDDAFMTSL